MKCLDISPLYEYYHRFLWWDKYDDDDDDNDDYDDHDYDDHDDCFRLSKLMVSNHYDAIYKCKTSNQWYQYKN